MWKIFSKIRNMELAFAKMLMLTKKTNVESTFDKTCIKKINFGFNIWKMLRKIKNIG